MLLSRFWYVIIAVALSAAVGGLFLARTIYNRSSRESMDQALAADTQVVGWFINDDARRRSSLLLKVCLDSTIRDQLSKASKNDSNVPRDAAEKTRGALSKLLVEMPDDYKFTSLFAVDQLGRVIGHVGFDQAAGVQDFELGGYAVVADALHGWVRDDAWVLDDRIFLVVARPVEVDTSQMPTGAIVGLRIIDASYARQLSKRSGATVGFFAGGSVKAKAAPEGFDPSKLDTIVADIKNLSEDAQYKEKGKSKPKILMGDVGVIYSKIPGEAWDLGAGYVVGRSASVVSNPIELLQLADTGDKKSVPWWLMGVTFIAVAGLGLFFSVLEHTRPLRTLKTEAERLAKGEIDTLQVSKFRGVYRKIASDLNDGTDKVAAKGGAPRKAADLESVLGPIPAKPEMSAFSFPMEAPHIASSPGSGPRSQPKMPPPSVPPMLARPVSVPQPPAIKAAPVQMPVPAGIKLATPKSALGPPMSEPPPAADPSESDGDGDDDATVVSAVPPEILEASATGAHRAVKEADEIAEWHNIFEEFVRTKKQCNEATAGLTFEKFQNTLRKNRDQLISKTGCKRVRFSVYVKDGRAALKASPVRV
ncbi:MAG: hypothetical protein MUF54_03540 [Polyangiaceae bacterium]|nr:hypothetical protein [Polyangiaceae bacterium]